jgi:hypothetical protein
MSMCGIGKEAFVTVRSNSNPGWYDVSRSNKMHVHTYTVQGVSQADDIRLSKDVVTCKVEEINSLTPTLISTN